MEANCNLDHYMSLGNEFKTSEHNIFNFDSPFVKESSEQSSIGCFSRAKLNENRNNRILHIQTPTKVLKSNCSSERSTELLSRLSLMKQFDPLHSLQQTMVINDDSSNTYSIRDSREIYPEIYDTVFPKEIVNKTMYKSYVDNTLISLESPMKIAKPIFPKVLLPDNTKLVKMYSQEEFHRLMTVQELYLQKEFSQKVLESEKAYAVKYQKLNGELSKLASVNRSFNSILSEMFITIESMKTSNKKNKIKLKDLYVSNEKLKLDIITSTEDFCSMESAFSEIYKRYETSKSMIKNYKENEKHLIKNIEGMQLTLGDKEIMNNMFKSPIQELTDTLAKEIDITKKSSNTQIMILKTQIKKCEIKIDSLENDLTQAKSSSGKIGSIWEDLMENFQQ